MDLREIATGITRVKNTIGLLRADDINTKRQIVACYDFMTNLEAGLTQVINEQAMKRGDDPAPKAEEVDSTKK